MRASARLQVNHALPARHATTLKSEEPLFYNPAPPVLFGAAGIDVDVAWLDGGSITATGNSFAAPVVAGYVARVLGEQPGLTPFQVTTILQATADNVRTATAETWGRG